MPRPRVAVIAACLALLASTAAPAGAAESEMVGLLAVAIEPEVAEQIELTPEQLQRLRDLADKREMDGMSRAMKAAKLPREERIASLADYRAESERLGLALLTPEQATRLREVAAKRDDPTLQNTPVAAPAEVPEPAQPEPPAQETTATPAEPAGASEPEAPAAAPGGEPAPEAPTLPSDGKLSFNFTQHPWEEVIRWFADHADLSVVVDTPPPGALNYRDDRRYTPAEALDVLNGVLLTKGYTLVRKDRMLLVINLEQDVIPPNVVTDVPLEELDQRGEYELVRVLVNLGDLDVPSVADSLQRLTGPQGTVIVLPEAQMLQVTETAGRIRTMLTVIEAMKRAAAPLTSDGVELRSYTVGGADAQTTLSVLQTLLGTSDTARLAVDEQTGSLIALASPDEHRAIDETLKKLQTDGRRVELIPVTEVDPLVAASIVTSLFSPKTGEEKKFDPNGPVIQADRYTDTLLVRGTAEQVTQIRRLVKDLDKPDASRLPGARGTVRTLPVTGQELEQSLQQIEMLWPRLSDNPLRLANPALGIPSFRPGAEVEREQLEEEDPLNLLYGPEDPPATPTEGRTTAAPGGSVFRFANQTEEGPEPTASDAPEPIYIAPGVGSTVIASQDAEALDTLEELLATVLDSSATGGRQYAVFYLKFADAKTAGALLNAIFGGEEGGGSGLMGDLAGAAIGGAGGDLVGDLLGMGSGSDALSFGSVSVDIVPDLRLNALYVHADPRDLMTVHQLLRIIDQPRGPDRIESTGVARLITVENTSATDVAAVVREVFKEQLEGGAGGGQPSPQQLLRALQGGGDGADEQEPETMTLSVDERSNSLVVRSSEPLFEKVRLLVEQLDRAGVERPVSTRVVSLHNTSSDALRETLVSLLGDKAVVAGATADASQQPAAQNNNGGNNGRRNNNDRAARETRERIEGMRRMQEAIQRFRRQQGGGGGRGGRGGGPPGGGGRGGR